MSSQSWTVLDISDQTGKTFIVTGANAGLGYESVRALARKNATVIMASRNLEWGEEARQNILKEIPRAELDLRHCDLADFSSIEKFARSVIKDYPRLDVLLNNAGLNMFRRQENADGYELTFAINHLGPFALTAYLFPILKKSAPSRVVMVASSAHLSGTIRFDNLMLTDGYSMMSAYGQSKLANVIFAKELQRRIERKGLDMLSIAAHPGLNRTNMMYRAGSRSRLFRGALDLLAGALTDHPEVGSRVQLYTATESDVEGGGYYVPNKGGRPKIGYSTPEANDPEVAVALWERSEKLVDLEFKL